MARVKATEVEAKKARVAAHVVYPAPAPSAVDRDKVPGAYPVVGPEPSIVKV